MAKRKRKIAASQKDQSKVAAAKYLKQQGLLSKQTKLHGGKYISRRVLNKVNELEWIAQNKYKAVPVKHSYAEQAQRNGMVTARRGNRDFAIVPNSPAEIKRVKRGIVSGVVPVPGGQIYSVIMPYNNLSDFVRAVNSGAVDDLKGPGEQFAFTYYGHMSRRAFRSGDEMREWLRRYDFVEWIGDADMSDQLEQSYAAFSLYRMLPGAWNPASFTERDSLRRGRRMTHQQMQDRRVSSRRTKRIAEISATAAEARRAYDRDRKKRARDELRTNDPEAYEAMLAANKARAIASRNRRKAK